MSLPSLGNDNENKQKLPSIPSLPVDFQYEYEDSEEEFDDNNFEDVDIEEVLSTDDEDSNHEIYREVKEIENPEELPTSSKYEEVDGDYQSYDDYNPDYEEDEESGKKKKFINKKSKKIIPFGGKKSMRKVKSLEMDDRKNTLAKTKITRFFILLVIATLFIIGLKNTFLPSHVYNEDQIRQIAKQSVGQTNFPSKRGEAFVEEFMTAYLTIDKSRPELNQILSYYYGEDLYYDLSDSTLNLITGKATQQNIISGPNVYEIDLLTDYSALYKVSAYVSNTNGVEVLGNNTNGRWLSFGVNVYYDKELDALAITPDSPSLIPTPIIAKQSNVPDRMPFGNGEVNNDIAPALNPTINGYVEAYSKASISSHESILQYISDKNDIKLYDGFGGSVELNGPAEQSIKKVIYNAPNNVYRVALTVSWVDTLAAKGDNKMEYTAKYVMTITPEGDGKYTVSSFEPYTFFTQ